MSIPQPSRRRGDEEEYMTVIMYSQSRGYVGTLRVDLVWISVLKGVRSSIYGVDTVTSGCYHVYLWLHVAAQAARNPPSFWNRTRARSSARLVCILPCRHLVRRHIDGACRDSSELRIRT